jgi:hypothetical protein
MAPYQEATMRQHLAMAARLFWPAHANAVLWVLAGCGWGMVLGATLEAAFGAGPDGLLDAAGQASLEALTGALLGMIGFTLLTAFLHTVTLVPAFYLIEKGSGRYPHGDASLGFLHERSPRTALATSLLLAVINGTWLAPMMGAGCFMESIHGTPLPNTFLLWGVLLGLLAGGIVGMVAMVRQFYREMPESWREEFRRGRRPDCRSVRAAPRATAKPPYLPPPSAGA